MDKVGNRLLGVVLNPIAQINYCVVYTGAKLKYMNTVHHNASVEWAWIITVLGKSSIIVL